MFGWHSRRRKRCKRHQGFCHHLVTGERFRILGYRGVNCLFRKKLLNLGLLKGEDFEIMGRAPMGDPIEIKINGYRLSIRADEAEELILEKIDNDK